MSVVKVLPPPFPPLPISRRDQMPFSMASLFPLPVETAAKLTIALQAKKRSLPDSCCPCCPRRVFREGLRDVLQKENNGSNVKLSQLMEEQRKLISEVFHSIFFDVVRLTEDEASSLFARYLNDKAIDYKVSGEKAYIKIHQMDVIIHYLKENPHVKKLDISPFETKANGIPMLAEYLKTSTVEAVKVNANISFEAKQLLADAALSRKGDLKVYFVATEQGITLRFRSLIQ